MSHYNNKKHIPVKESFGIILCKHVPTEPLNVLVVKKRYTYSYAEFIHGHYSIKDLRKVYGLFEHMTPEELLDIWSLNFPQMWFRIWLSYDQTTHYNKKYKKFYNAFMKHDNGKKLRKTVESTKNYSGLYYEFPKGKQIIVEDPIQKVITTEDPLVCAIREFEEETKINKKYYKIINGFNRRFSYIHMGVKYVNTYFLALAKPNLLTKNIYEFCHDITNSEVTEVKWVTTRELQIIDSKNNMLTKLIKPAFNMIKNYIKGKKSNNIIT